MVAALLASGLTEAYFSYQDKKKSISDVQRQRAASATTSIERRIADIRKQIQDVARARPPADRKDWTYGSSTTCGCCTASRS